MRAFVAINIPHAERQRLHDALAPLRDAALPVRWAAPESLHVTLVFLGRIDDRTADIVQRILHRVASGHEPFDLEIRGLGAFPGLGRPRVWWVGVTPAPPLLSLQSGVETALAGAGFASEDRPYSPHVTIGRANERTRIGARADAFLRAFDFRARVPVRSVDLMESRPSPRGACYHAVMQAPLGMVREHGSEPA